MREWPTAASTQHTRLCLCWTVSLCFYKTKCYFFIISLAFHHSFSLYFLISFTSCLLCSPPTINSSISFLLWPFRYTLDSFKAPNCFLLQCFLLSLCSFYWHISLSKTICCVTKGHVVPVSLPAVPGSVFSSSGCVMDGTTALTERTSRLVATPPILHSVSPCYLWPRSQSH